MAVTEQALDEWWAGLTDAERTHLMDVGAYQGMMDATTDALVARLPGVRRLQGSFGGNAFPERMPEPPRAYVRQQKYLRDEAAGAP